MCTIVILLGIHKKYPMIIAANRDEAYNRPAFKPGLVQEIPTRSFAPVDMNSSGTWIGISEGSWFAGMTHQDSNESERMWERTPEIKQLSRGPVVMGCVKAANHRLATKLLAELDMSKYESFNMVYGRPQAMFLCKAMHKATLEISALEEGITVVTNDTSDSNFYVRKESRATVLASAVDEDDEDVVIMSKLLTMLSDHDTSSRDPHMSMCVHDTLGKYGTLSSSVMLFAEDGNTTYYHKDGHACSSNSFIKVR